MNWKKFRKPYVSYTKYPDAEAMEAETRKLLASTPKPVPVPLASPQQKKYMRFLGMEIPKGLTKREASFLIGQSAQRRAHESQQSRRWRGDGPSQEKVPITDAQRAEMDALGIRSAKTMRKSTAQIKIEAAKRRRLGQRE